LDNNYLLENLLKKVFKKMNKKYVTVIVLVVLISTIYSGCIDEKTPKEPEKPTTSDIAVFFLTNLSESNYEKAYSFFSDALQDVLPLDQLPVVWESVINLYGDMEEILSVQEKEHDDYILIFLNTTFSNNYFLIFRVVFNQENQIEGFYIDSVEPITGYVLPSYVDPDLFTEFDVVIGNEWPLPATLTIPQGAGPFPAVVLIHGSGPNDRDETIGPNKPFKDIAGGLASQGIAVLRYDKRTFAYPNETSSDPNLTLYTEVIEDAIAAVDFLSTHPLVDNDHIVLIGHSLGAMMAPKVALLDARVSAIVLLAAPARPLEDAILHQYTYLLLLDGKIDEAEQNFLDELNESIMKIKTLNISDDEFVLNAPKAYWEYLSTYDPLNTAAALDIPFLILQGMRDYQVTYDDDFIMLEKTFMNMTHTTFIAYESLNHLFIAGEGTPTNTEYFLQGNVAEKVISDIVTWIKNLVGQ